VEALAVQKRAQDKSLGQVLIDLGYVSQVDVDVALAAQKGETSDQLPGPERREQMFGNDIVGKIATAATAAARPCRVFVMPGVPKEMKAMFAQSVLPQLEQQGGGAVILSRTLHTFGLGESWVA